MQNSTQPVDIVALAYNLSDVDFLTMSPPPEESADTSSSSFNLSGLFHSQQNDSIDATEIPVKVQSSGQATSSKASANTTCDDVSTIDLTSPEPAELVENTPISPPDSTASPQPGPTSVSPSQVYRSSVLQSPESLSSDSSCAGDLSNTSSLLLQNNKDNDESIIDFLLSEDTMPLQTNSSSQSQKQHPKLDTSRRSTESNKRKQPEPDSDEVQCAPELNINNQITQKLDNFFNSIPDIRNEYQGKPSERSCISPYMCEADWLELIAKCSPYSCRSSSCAPPAAKRHCSPQHRQHISIPAKLSSPEIQPMSRPTSNVSLNNLPVRNMHHKNQHITIIPQFPTPQGQPAAAMNTNLHQPPQQQQQKQAFTVTQKLSVLSGVTFHGASNAQLTAAQERAEKLKGKPSDTYIALIARAILSSPNLTSSLPDIYEQIMVQQPFYRTSTLAWRNAVRHNLSINECFVKVGKADSGRGWKWTIHPSCVEQFRSGDFRRREARSKVQQVQKKVQPSFTTSSMKY